MTILILVLIVILAILTVGFALYMMSDSGLIGWAIGGEVIKITLEVACSLITALLKQ